MRLSDQLAADGSRAGSREWVRDRLAALPAGDRWAEDAAGRDLVQWLYTVVRRRVAAYALAPHERADVAQDAMSDVARTLATSRERIAVAANPAAVLERIAARAAGAARHNARMCGLGGAPPNGRNWRTRYPVRVGGEAARRICEQVPVPALDPCREVENAADVVVRWVADTLGITLTEDGRDAVMYVLDRLVAGVSRAALVRGAHSRLAADQAMRHLGFGPKEASAFAVWLLGRSDAHHHTPSVLDAALIGVHCERADIDRWREIATACSFPHALPHVA